MNHSCTGSRISGSIAKSCAVAGLVLTDSTYASHYEIAQHRHELAGFNLLLRGSYSEIYSRREVSCVPHSLLFRPPGEVHSDYFNEKESHLFVIEMQPQWMDRLNQCSDKMCNPDVFQNGLLPWLAMRLYREFNQMDEVSPLAIEGLALEILTEASRRSVRAARSQPPCWLKQSKELLHEQFSESLTLSRIAATVGVHPVYLASQFRRHYDCTVGEYVRRLRIEFACGEIASSDSSLVEIALAAGFANQAHFTRTFKQMKGITPSKYRTIYQTS